MSSYNLNLYTTAYENARYDRLSTSGTGEIATISTDLHMLDTSYYRSFGTYRRDIISSDFNTKVNETYIDEDLIKKYFYRADLMQEEKKLVDNSEETTIVNSSVFVHDTSFCFPGCVINKDYACNGYLASLEDLFGYYGYDYLKAYDSLDSVRSTRNASNNYFDIATTDNKDTYVDGSYKILSIGSTYKNFDADDLTGDDTFKIETIEYDGTYVPTVKEILSGELYIVIQSGSMYPKKVYFNNKYMPSLFINDDKYYNRNDMYVISEQQGVMLCDIDIHTRVGFYIKWDRPITINNIWNIVSYLKEDNENFNNLTSDNSSDNAPSLNISKNNIRLKAFYQITYEYNGNTYTLMAGILKDYCEDLNVLPYTGAEGTPVDFVAYGGEEKNIPLDPMYFFENINYNKTDNIICDNKYDEVTLHIKIGLALQLNGYTFKDTLYLLSWYIITKNQEEEEEEVETTKWYYMYYTSLPDGTTWTTTTSSISINLCFYASGIDENTVNNWSITPNTSDTRTLCIKYWANDDQVTPTTISMDIEPSSISNSAVYASTKNYSGYKTYTADVNNLKIDGTKGKWSALQAGTYNIGTTFWISDNILKISNTLEYGGTQEDSSKRISDITINNNFTYYEMGINNITASCSTKEAATGKTEYVTVNFKIYAKKLLADAPNAEIVFNITDITFNGNDGGTWSAYNGSGLARMNSNESDGTFKHDGLHISINSTNECYTLVSLFTCYAPFTGCKVLRIGYYLFNYEILTITNNSTSATLSKNNIKVINTNPITINL